MPLIVKPFLHAHATHPEARTALALAAAQIEAQRSQAPDGFEPTLGWLYLNEAYAAAAEGLLDELRQRWPGVAWVGASAPAICASGVEYFDEPALALMLAELPREQFRVFSGRRPLGPWAPQCALVHADASTPDLQELLQELAAATGDRYLFGGLAVGQRDAVQLAEGVWRGGLSGVGFGPGLRLLSRVSQGCQARGPERRVTACEGHMLLELDGRPALDCLLQDLTLPVAAGSTELRLALPQIRRTLVGLSDAGSRDRREYGPEVLVRHLVGLDPARRSLAIADNLQPGQSLSFCERSPEAARRDLLRICTELRAETEESGHRLAGALYTSCTGRGGPHFGAPSAELQWLRHGLGELPLVGFFTGGEIAHGGRLYGYSGVLSAFVSD